MTQPVIQQHFGSSAIWGKLESPAIRIPKFALARSGDA